MMGTRAADRGRVLFVQYANPAVYPPLQHSASLLAEAGFDVLMLGVEIDGMTLHAEPHPRVQTELMSAASGGWRRKIHYARFAAWVAQWTRRFRPSWLYASDALAAPAALAAASVRHVNVIYHEHDEPVPGRAGAHSAVMRTVLAARTRLAREAAACIVPNDARAARLATQTGRSDIACVWNCPRRSEGVGGGGAAGGVLRVVYHGSIVPDRVPLAVIRAVGAVPGVELAIGGYETAGHRGYATEVRAQAAALGVADRVTVGGLIPARAALLAHGRAFDVGLSLVQPAGRDVNQRAMVGASNKPFEYLASGLALLVAEDPVWTQTFVDAGYGRACDPASPESIGAAFRWFANHREELRTMGRQGLARIRRDWNYERTFAPILEMMIESTRGSRRVSRSA